jgi:hypothetical protein
MSYTVNEQIIDTLEEVRFQNGLNTSNFIIRLVNNGVISTQPVLITGLGSGLYSLSFTPNAVGTWSLSVRVASYQRARYQKSYNVTLASEQSILEADLSGFIAPGNVADYINRIKKYSANRVIIDGDDYRVKEDDGVTDFELGKVNSSERRPL